VRLPPLPSSPLSIHILPRPTEASRTSFPSLPTQSVTQTRTFSFPASMIPQTRLEQYLAAQPGAIRGPYCAEHIRRRRWRWTGLRCIQPKHLLDCSARTGSGQTHVTEKDRSLGGTARGLNAVPSKQEASPNTTARRPTAVSTQWIDMGLPALQGAPMQTMEPPRPRVWARGGTERRTWAASRRDMSKKATTEHGEYQPIPPNHRKAVGHVKTNNHILCHVMERSIEWELNGNRTRTGWFGSA